LKTPAAPRVLIVEDEPDIAALIAYQLTRAGYRVETVRTGPEALRSVGRDVPALVRGFRPPYSHGFSVLSK
jgi:DNA-binding response OmpR family regulator